MNNVGNGFSGGKGFSKKREQFLIYLIHQGVHEEMDDQRER